MNIIYNINYNINLKNITYILSLINTKHIKKHNTNIFKLSSQLTFDNTKVRLINLMS